MGQYKMQISEKNGSFLNANQHEMQLKDSGVARVFFALWPEALVRQALHTLATEYQLRCEARAMRAETLHMTLLFLGEVEHARLPQLMQAADSVSVAPFGFVLERLSFWPHNRIANATSLAEVLALNQLVTALKQKLVPLAEEVNRIGAAGLSADDLATARSVLLAIITNLADDVSAGS